MSLTEAEKQDLARRIPRGIQVISSSLAQLHLSSPDPSVNPYEDETGIVASLRSFGEKRWKFTNIEGALLLTRDKDGIHHFRIYDLAEYKLRFQYELYENLEYVRLADTFHAFEMEKCVGGFNFSSKDVADKFYERVQRNIIHNGNVIYSVPQPASFTSPGFMPPVMQTQKATFSNQEMGSKNGVGLGGSENKKSRAKGKKRKPTQTGSTPATQPPKPAASEVSSNTGGAIFLANGLVDPNSIPSEWKKILKTAGIRKKDLLNPQMQEVIRETLEKFNISLDPPPLDMDDAEVRQYYSADQLAEYEAYKKEMANYEQAVERYEAEMAEYERKQEKQKKLDRLIKQQESAVPAVGPGANAEERLRMSVRQFQGKELQSVLPAAIQAREEMAPQMTAARPLVPALPVIPEVQERNRQSAIFQRQQLESIQRAPADLKNKRSSNNPADSNAMQMKKLQDMVESRNSKMMIQPGFLSEIKKQDFALKHVSMLPNLSKVKEGDKDGILNTLMEKIKQQRKDLGEDDDNDDFDDDFDAI